MSHCALDRDRVADDHARDLTEKRGEVRVEIFRPNDR
jgi:hypothetical protein